MKKLIILYSLFSIQYLPAATCPTGYTVPEEYQIVADSAACPTGYAETTEIIIVQPGTSCPPGYVETTELLAGWCDTSRGTCNYDAFTCTGP